MQTILGAGGPVGKALARELTQYTDSIRLFSRKPVAVNPKDQLMAGDITNPDDVMKAVEGSEVVYLVVGFPYDKKVWKEKWPVTMENTIAACKRYGASLVFFDNIYMYDRDHLQNISEETPVRPTSEKGKIRAQITNKLMEAGNEGEVNVLIARSADFYGASIEKTSMLTEMMLDNLSKGKKANWLGGEDYIHSFTYVPNAAKATAMLGNTPDAYGQVWHLPTSHQKWTARDWVNEIARQMGTKPRLSVLPPWLLKVLAGIVPVMREIKEMSYQYDRHYYFNSKKFEERFDFHPTSYEEGINQIIRQDYTS